MNRVIQLLLFLALRIMSDDDVTKKLLRINLQKICFKLLNTQLTRTSIDRSSDTLTQKACSEARASEFYNFNEPSSNYNEFPHCQT